MMLLEAGVPKVLTPAPEGPTECVVGEGTHRAGQSVFNNTVRLGLLSTAECPGVAANL